MNLDLVPNLIRIESNDKNEMQERCMEMTHSMYPHDKIYGDFCTLQTYINCPADMAFEYLAQAPLLEEWTFSLRDLMPTDIKNVYEFTDKIGGKTKCFCKTVSNREAMTVDYHCAWDQGEHLWMVYLMRVIPAPLVLDKPGCVVLWTNCHHPFYDKNPYPDQAPKDRQVWVGDGWPMFYAGHSIELDNLKHILEYRHANSIKVMSVER